MGEYKSTLTFFIILIFFFLVRSTLIIFLPQLSKQCFYKGREIGSVWSLMAFFFLNSLSFVLVSLSNLINFFTRFILTKISNLVYSLAWEQENSVYCSYVAREQIVRIRLWSFFMFWNSSLSLGWPYITNEILNFYRDYVGLLFMILQRDRGNRICMYLHNERAFRELAPWL